MKFRYLVKRLIKTENYLGANNQNYFSLNLLNFFRPFQFHSNFTVIFIVILGWKGRIYEDSCLKILIYCGTGPTRRRPCSCTSPRPGPCRTRLTAAGRNIIIKDVLVVVCTENLRQYYRNLF